MSVKLTLTGFDTYLVRLKNAGADVRKTAEKALLESARVFKTSLEKNVNASPMSAEVKRKIMSSMIQPRISHSTDYFVQAETGFKKGDYNPDNLSGGYVALFNEYGTVERRTGEGYSRGSLEELEFTRRAIKESKNKIRKLQEDVLNEALEGLDT